MYTKNNYENLIGIDFLSETLLRNHFSLYEGYVNNTNSILEILKNNKSNSFIEFSELQRRLSWEYNGMKLHELYFENLIKQNNEEINYINTESNFYKKIIEVYGSFENFKTNFQEMGKIRGIGWIALIKDENEELFIIWINEHNEGNFANSKIILIMDIFEHAFITDYGIKKIDYINKFWDNINWNIVEKRFER